jgi:serine/threonine-protein kinase RsbW
VTTVTVSFTAVPAHVRTARFIVASVARRAGVAESILDEIRLAVSEACSLAVRFHLVHAPGSPVELRLTESVDQFSVQVADAVGRSAPDGGDLTLDLSDDELGLEAFEARTALNTGGTPSGSAVGLAPSANGNASQGSRTSAFDGDDRASAADLRGHERIGLAVISGLVDDVTVEYLDSGSVVTMTWPIVVDEAGVRSSASGVH